MMHSLPVACSFTTLRHKYYARADLLPDRILQHMLPSSCMPCVAEIGTVACIADACLVRSSIPEARAIHSDVVSLLLQSLSVG